MSEPQIFIDRRPITVVFFSRTYRLWLLSLLGIAFYLFVSATPWQGLSHEGYRAIGTLVLCAVLWLSQLIPLAITGLLAIVLIPLLGILPSRQVFSYFGNEAVFFILGAFILSAAVMRTGLSTRLSLFFLQRKNLTPKKLTFYILLATASLSCLMSEHAVAAFFFPIVLQIARALEFEPFGGEYGKTLFLALAWGCIIGGIVTFLGGARAPLALGILSEITGKTISFFDWIKITILIAAPMFGIAYLLLTRYFKIDVTTVENARLVLEKKKLAIGRISFKEGMVAFVLLTSIFFWITSGGHNLANVAIIAVVSLFVFRLVSWKDIEEYVNWGIILMYGGAIALGRAVDSSGALEWLSDHVMVFPQILSQSFGETNGFWLVVIISALTLFLTELFSNAAVVALLLPISIQMAVSFNIDPTAMTYAVAIPAGLPFVMPMGTPAMAIAYSSGYLKIKEVALTGVLLNLTAWMFFVLTVKLVWPLLGIDL